ncbi:MAG: hypothetical protein ACKVY0_12845 [Prosthecobacter sp.]|uniref:hypothetical protein n=1 Tax=Prosthecobacter sp. TaxID=1965333 RepID=UPI0039020339
MKPIFPLSLSLFTAASFAVAQDTARLDTGDPAARPATAPTLKPATQENVIVYKEAGRHGDWPANHGKVMTIYYYNGPEQDDRAIEGTLWTP